MKQYADIADLPEDRRIEVIGANALKKGKVAFCTDAEPGKADRYIAKLLAQFPQLEVFGRYPGPIADVVTVIVRRKPA